MSHDAHDVTLAELSKLSGVSVRTVRYYIQQGLLPAPGSGRGVRYNQGHLNRMKLIKLLQEDDIPLAKIREQLEALTDENIQQLLDQQIEATSKSNLPLNAVDYIKYVLAGSGSRTTSSSSRSSPTLSGRTPNSVPGLTRSTWDRIKIDPDIEMHVRRPLTRSKNRRLDKLIKLARELFEEVE